MDIVQLRYFQAVAKSGHLTNAAKMLNIAQPALSVSISRLEKEIGVPLFDRVGRNIYLNHSGEIFLEYAEEAIAAIDKAQKEIDEYNNKQENIMNLGVVSKPVAWKLLADFKELFPEGLIRQMDIPADSVEDELHKGTVDYVISSVENTSPELVSEIIAETPMVLAVPSSHPFAMRDSIKLSEASKEEFINLPKTYEYRKITDQMCTDSGFTANVTNECFHCHMAEMVASGKGVALMTEERARQNYGNRNIEFIPIVEPGYTRKQYLIWKANHHFNKMSREFRRYLRNNYKKYSSMGCGGCE